MDGWIGKLLRVDLSSHGHCEESLDIDILHRYVGGKGLAGYLLRDYITETWDSPDMPLVFATGPLVGTASPTSGRMGVASRSPLTGTIGDASVGGFFATDLKKAGYDAVVITGQSRQLCGIEINDSHITITDATAAYGLSTSELTAKLKEKGRCAVTGPAADNGVRFANIIFDGHYAAGRNGLGLVMAAKNLKYVCVRGSGKVSVADPEGLKKAREDIFRLGAASPVLMGELGITNFGTAAIYDLTSSRRMMPTANFRRTYFQAAATTNAFAYKQKYNPKKSGCRGCHILCKKSSGDGKLLPEFETMNHFHALLENEDMDIAMEANHICNEAGMDTITAGVTLACHAEIRGSRLQPGEITATLAEIAAGKGLGRELGQGSLRYAKNQGRAETSMTVKGLELPAYDPRGAYGMALGYAVSTRGGCHLRAYPIANEILRKPVATDRFSFSGKARIVKIAEDANAMVDSLTACKFIFFGATLEEFAKAYTSATGIEASGQDLLQTGERIYYAERIMNAQNGFSAKDDDLPERFFREPGSSGNNIEINPINRDDFLSARANYYQVRGLDSEGRPTREKAEELEIPWKN